VPTVHVVQHSSATSEQVLEAAHDFTERRAELWRDVYVEHMTIHDRGETWADVTEGNPWGPWLVWERLRYDWSEPGSLRGTVIESNLFKPGSTPGRSTQHRQKAGAGSRSSRFGVCGGSAGSFGRSFQPAWHDAT
jgi:hypothetical protein